MTCEEWIAANPRWEGWTTGQIWDAATLAERERCAKVADSFCYPVQDVGRIAGHGDEAEAIAEEIRREP